ncbi:MAG: lipoprotein [Candidatus Fonsibacter sp.]
MRKIFIFLFFTLFLTSCGVKNNPVYQSQQNFEYQKLFSLKIIKFYS